VKLRGLYAITSEQICRSPGTLCAAVELALEGGAELIQYRDKSGESAQRLLNGRALRALCDRHHALLIVNDDPQLAVAVAADGVHLGQADARIETARSICGPKAIIGVSCSNSIERALAAVAAGADYVAFGRFFPSRTKPDAPPADLSLLRDARARIRAPICAIGGITPALARSVVEAGADLVAAVEGIFGAADIRAAAGEYAAIFREDADR